MVKFCIYFAGLLGFLVIDTLAFMSAVELSGWNVAVLVLGFVAAVAAWAALLLSFIETEGWGALK